MRTIVTITTKGAKKKDELMKIKRIPGGKLIGPYAGIRTQTGIVFSTHNVEQFIDSIEDLGMGMPRVSYTDVSTTGKRHVRVTV